MKNKLLLLLFMIPMMSLKQDNPAYFLVDSSGNEIKYSKMIDELAEADVVLIGELHNNPISHWLELEITEDLHAVKKDKLVLGAEMFERDNQLLLNEYIRGIHTDAKFEADARLWKNYKTDYKPIVDFAKENTINFIATNIPRRYASLVFQGGFEALEKLDPEAKKLFAELPIRYDEQLPCYASLLDAGPSGHSNANLPKAQAIKDATMAESILRNRKGNQLFLHYNGAYHSDDHTSIVWYLKQADPSLKILTLTTVEFSNADSIPDSTYQKADYLILVPENMTKTN